MENIKELLTFNGFENTRRQDYYNKEFGLELEDMHDENAIVKDDLLFFIDTVFYIMERIVTPNFHFPVITYFSFP